METKSAPKQKRLAECKSKKEDFQEFIKDLDTVFTIGNMILSSKKGSEVLKDGTVIDKKYLQAQQRDFKNAIQSFFNEVIADAYKSRKVQTKEQKGTKLPTPCFYKIELVNWLNDPKTKLGRKDIKAQMNSESFEDTVTYNGENLNKALSMCRNNIIGLGDSGTEIKILGLGSKSVISTLFNYYIDANNLKGVKETTKDGKEKINRKYWKLDENLKKHFGNYFEEIIKKAQEKDPNVSEEKIPLGSLMSLSSKLVDNEKNKSYPKEVMKDPLLSEIILTDIQLLSTIYKSIKEVK